MIRSFRKNILEIHCFWKMSVQICALIRLRVETKLIISFSMIWKHSFSILSIRFCFTAFVLFSENTCLRFSSGIYGIDMFLRIWLGLHQRTTIINIDISNFRIRMLHSNVAINAECSFWNVVAIRTCESWLLVAYIFQVLSQVIVAVVHAWTIWTRV